VRGVLLVGGLGTRSMPFSAIINKCLLPVGREPILYNSIRQMALSGISDIAFVGDTRCLNDISILVEHDRHNWPDANFVYCEQQEQSGGIDALVCAKKFIGNDCSMVILGDNILTHPITRFVSNFNAQSCGARILLYENRVACSGYGMTEVCGNSVLRITDNSSISAGQYIATGYMIYDSEVFNIIDSIGGGRGLTFVNNEYAASGIMEYDVIDGLWDDAGTIKGRMRVDRIFQEIGHEIKKN